MAEVFVPALLAPLTGGQTSVEANGETVRQVLQDLANRFPAFVERLLENGRLRSGIFVAIDGEVRPMGLAEPVRPTSEIHFVTAVRGGCPWR